MVRAVIAGFLVLGLSGSMAVAQSDAPAKVAAPAGAKAYIISPADGETVSSPVRVQFGLSGMGVAPAGVDWDDTGHHHLIVDVDLPPTDTFIPPSDDTYRHFGGGQTETVVELAPGEHTLQLLLGDHTHLPHATPIYSEKITITVQ